MQYVFVATTRREMQRRPRTRKRRRVGYRTLQLSRIRLASGTLAQVENGVQSREVAQSSHPAGEIGVVAEDSDIAVLKLDNDHDDMEENWPNAQDDEPQREVVNGTVPDDDGDREQEGGEYMPLLYEDDDLDEDFDWADAVAAVESGEVFDSNVPEASLETEQSSSSDFRLDEKAIRTLMHGKSLEALSYVAGTTCVHVKQYEEFRPTLNEYASRLRESRYPCYTTLLYKSLKLLRSIVFTRQVKVRASVNVSRSGVMQKYILEQQRGGTPELHIPVVPPSEWARRDLLTYDYMTRHSTSPHAAANRALL